MQDHETIINQRLGPFLSRYPRIGVMVSGGIDSGTVLYLTLKYISDNGLSNTITAFTVNRTADTASTAEDIIEYYRQVFPAIAIVHTKIDPWVGPENHNYQTMSGIYTARNNDWCDGVIVADTKMPDHDLLSSMKNPDRFHNIAPDILQLVIDFTKDITVGLAIKHDLTRLFELSHSCIKMTSGRCNNCYWCLERAWAFQQNNAIDPGTN